MIDDVDDDCEDDFEKNYFKFCETVKISEIQNFQFLYLPLSVALAKSVARQI